jgi:PAS domain S-box-containing protein
MRERFSISEKLTETGVALVYRGYNLSTGEPVILKIVKNDAAIKDHCARFRRELDKIKRLQLPFAKAFHIEEYQGSLMMVLGDNGGYSLDHILNQKQLPLIVSLELAIEITDAIGAIHKHFMFHGNLNPSGIIWNSETKQLRFIEFGSDDKMPEYNTSAVFSSVMESTLEYISPEQTGRMNRIVDYRTDFYSLGVIFYTMLTGKHPFETQDPLTMIHSHIARVPVPPHELHADIPEILSRIVMKLLSKLPDDRYQSASGLKLDLEHCRQEFLNSGLIQPFKIGDDDYTDRLRIPRKLYGREHEIELLLGAVKRVCSGEKILFLVEGYAGIGKTSLIHEVHHPVTDQNGFFIEGKFDQLRRNVPYYAWIQAFTGFVNYLLMESEAEIAQWRAKVLDALGNNGKILTDVIPNLELIIGPQASVPELSGIGAQNRFNYLFLKFVKAIATKERPLVIFLDDMQWVESASLRLFETLMTDNDVSNVLVIGAYRDNEVDELHPLIKSVASMRKENTGIEKITLQELTEKTVNELIANTLHRKYDDTVFFTRIIYSKTGGNPFSLLQTLGALAEKQVVSFETGNREWQWDIEALKIIEITDNIVNLMLGKIQNLAQESQQVLLLASCIGFRFSLSNLSIVSNQKEELVLELLQPALHDELIIPLDGMYQFVHDRIQQAAYSLIPDTDKKSVHLKIGKLLLQYIPESGREEQIFMIVDHLNKGAELIEGKVEKLELAQLNLLAGSKAKASAAFSVAARYFESGVAMLDEYTWINNYDLAFSLHTRLAECECLIGNFTRSEKLYDVAIEHAGSFLDRALIYRMYQRLYQQSGRWSEAVTAALQGLKLLGMSFPKSDQEIRLATEAEKMQIQINLRNRCIADLAAVPFTNDAESQVLIGLLAESITQFFITRPVLWHLIVLKCVNLCLERGNVEEAPYIYSSYCKMLVALYNDIPSAFEFSQMSLKLNEHPSKGGFMKGLPPFFHASVVSNWRQHFEVNLPLFDQAFQAFLDSGDIIWAGYLSYNSVWLHLENGDPLEQIIVLARRYAAFTRQSHNHIVYNVDRIEEHFALCLQGKTRSLTDFNNETFDEAASVAAIEKASFGIGIGYYRIMKQITAFIAGQYDEALLWADRVMPVLDSVSSMAIWGTYYFYNALTLTALYDQVDEEQKPGFINRIVGIMEKLKSWAHNCPENFENRAVLIEAEIARIERRDQDAMYLYEKAINSARGNRFIQNEAIAYEIAAAFYRQRGFEKIFRTYLIEASTCYAGWGAEGKVRQLERLFPWLVQEQQPEAVTFAERLDAVSLAKAQQTISSEREMDKLIDKIIQIVVENAGAQRGFLLFEQGDGLRIMAKGGIDASEVKASLPIKMDECSLVANGVVLFVTRTKECIVLDDAANQGDFIDDPHIRQEQTRSVLCAPLLYLGKLIGILYLENNLAPGIFTPQRRTVIEMLASQAAISLETSIAYEQLRKSNDLLAATQQLAKTGGWEYEVASGTSFWTDELFEIHEIPNCPDINHISESLKCFRPDDRPIILKAFRNACEKGEPYDLEFPFTTFKGKQLWIRTTAKPVFEDGRVVRLIGNMIDLTARKLVEDALRNSEQRLAEAQRIAHIGSWELDLTTNVLTWSEEIFRIFEIDPEKFGATYESFLNTIHPDDREAVNFAYTNSLETRTAYEIDHRLLFGDGRVKYVHEQCETFYSEENPVRSIGTVQDITDRKRAEEALRQFNQELEQRVRERTMQLETANKELEAFAYSVSHDLRSPLRHIDGFLEMLQKRAENSFDDVSRHYMSTISNATSKMGLLIDNLLSFSRQGRQEMSMHPVVLESLVHDVIRELELDTGGRNIEWCVGELPVVTGDAAMLRIVFVNLLSNALKFTKPRQLARIEINSTRDANADTVIFVRDNGVGFDMEYAGKLFGVFQRLHRNDEFEGTGIGLANVRRIIGRHGGRTWAEGQVGKGASIYFTVPVTFKENVHG